MKNYGGSLKNHFLRRHLQKNNKGMAWQKRGGGCVFLMGVDSPIRVRGGGQVMQGGLYKMGVWTPLPTMSTDFQHLRTQNNVN